MIWVVASTTFFGIATIIASLIDNTGNTGHKIAGIWGNSILTAGRIRVKVRGLSRIDPKRSYIYMVNHQSNFDIPVLLSSLPVQFRWIAKAELFRIPLFGVAMQRAGYISIDRSNWRSAVASLKRAAQMIKNGVSVVIFPEGTRSLDGHLGPFKKGGFVLAVDAQVKVVPIVIHGTYDIMPKDTLRITPQDVLLEIKPPISTAGYHRKNKEILMEKVRRALCDSNPGSLQTC
jgi:1-acyl-sn-glycerol-3-phosphate acyltransferase